MVLDRIDRVRMGRSPVKSASSERSDPHNTVLPPFFLTVVMIVKGSKKTEATGCYSLHRYGSVVLDLVQLRLVCLVHRGFRVIK